VFLEKQLSCSQEPATGPNPEPDAYTFPHYFPKSHCNIIFPSMSRSSAWPLPFRFATQVLYAFHMSPLRATFFAHHILHDLITLIIFGEVYKL
jgi:hypothetical protein